MIINLIHLSLCTFPASLILGLIFLLLLWLLDHYYHHTSGYAFLVSPLFAIVISILTALCIALEGIWGFKIYHSIPFLILILLFMISLGLAIMKRLRVNPRIGFLCNHAGLFIIAWAMFFGAPDTIQGHMVVYKGEAEALAYTEQGITLPLPYYISLDHFEIEYYDNLKTPRQYHSKLIIEEKEYDISVNSPAYHKGFHIYQSAFDKEHESYVVLQLVKDPWLWMVYLGIIVLAMGSILLIFKPL